MAHQEKPVSAPGHIAADFAVFGAVSGYVDRNVCRAAITCDIVDGDLAAFVQNCTHGSHGSFYLVFARGDAFHVCQGRHQADGAVTAHAQVADIVKEDDTGGAGWIEGIGEQSAHHDVGTARLVNHSGAKTVVLGAKTLQTVDKRTRPKIGPATHD